MASQELEDRLLLSALTVNSALDNTTAGDGLVTLREAILAANTNTITDLGETGAAGLDVIIFGDGSGVGGTNFLDSTPDTIFLPFGQMAITDDLTITGLGQASTIIDAQLNSRIFAISGADVDVTLDGLTLRNGNSGVAVGGAV